MIMLIPLNNSTKIILVASLGYFSSDVEGENANDYTGFEFCKHHLAVFLPVCNFLVVLYVTLSVCPFIRPSVHPSVLQSFYTEDP